MRSAVTVRSNVSYLGCCAKRPTYIRIPQRPKEQESSFKEKTQADIIAVGKGGLPPLIGLTLNVEWKGTIERGQAPLPNCDYRSSSCFCEGWPLLIMRGELSLASS